MRRAIIHAAGGVTILLLMGVGTPAAKVSDVRGQHNRPTQTNETVTSSRSSDPLTQIAKGFPGSVKLKNKGHLLEFCPDNTCDGFVASADAGVATLKDFAFLYVCYFSKYTYLAEWRKKQSVRQTALRILMKPEYGNCKGRSPAGDARCILLSLNRDRKIRLISVRYDEGHRDVAPEDIAKELAKQAVNR